MCLHRPVDASYVMIRMQLHAKTNMLTLQLTYVITSYFSLRGLSGYPVLLRLFHLLKSADSEFV